MIMDPKYIGFSNYSGGSMIDEQTLFLNSDQNPDAQTGFKFDSPSLDLNLMDFPFDPPDLGANDLGLSYAFNPGKESFVPSFSQDDESVEPSLGWSQEGDTYPSSPSDDSDSSDPVLKYISQMLMEENMEDKPHMFFDPLALKAAEKSLFDVLGEQNPSLLKSPQSYVNYESPDSNHSGSGSDYSSNTSNSTGTTISTGDFFDPQRVGDVRESNPILSRTNIPYDFHFQSNNSQPSLQFLVNPSNGLPDIGKGPMGVNEMVQNIFSDADSVLQFQRGLEEASKFLPKASQLVIDLESNGFATKQKEEASFSLVNNEKIERAGSPNGSRGRKNHERGDSDLEQERSSKQSAVYVEEGEISDMFDKVLLWPGLKGAQWCCEPEVKQDGKSKSTPEPDEQSNGSNGGKTRAKKQGKKKETVDLRSLLILCAQAISGNDFRTSNELLKQIRQHSSPSGDGCQRLAHYFANGLEARLAGSGAGMPNIHTFLAAKRMTAADMLKAYKTHLHACPFKKLSILFANKMILHAAENAATLHIIDFGVVYGFQWPILIQLLSMLPNGPPKLRITGIELPQHGFRPAERILETGRRLARYCELFKVPFEYNPLPAQNWENIPIEDLKIRKDEVLAVNCLGRFKNLFDETAEADCQRDNVLNLIRRINPNIFVHCIINGSYNAPFFATRFREALFHFSSLFDMFDSTLPREDPERLMFEREFYGREAINVVACEGVERVERPETYKQWQARTSRAGFKQLPLDQMVMDKCRDKLKMWYHKNFVIDEDNNWMLQGWKGRIIYASSCWVPA